MAWSASWSQDGESLVARRPFSVHADNRKFRDAPFDDVDRSYMDSVPWAFHRLHELGLLYEGHKVVPYCCRCQTPLSNFEAKLDDAYRPRSDESCTVKFRLRDDVATSFLAWTTTPWTLPSNVALAVNPDLEYVQCLVDGKHVWVAAEARLRFSQLSEPLRQVKGRELIGLHYEPVFPHFASLTGAFVILPAHFVSAQSNARTARIEILCRLDLAS